MIRIGQERPPTRGEEIANAVTHGAGLVASLAAVPLLVLAAAARGDAWQVVACTVFGATLVLLYAISTAYHAVSHPPAKRMLQIADHAAIYLLIAGTYTPFMLGVLRNLWGWVILGVVWGLAAAGVLFKTRFGPRFPRLSLAGYLGMGWLGLIAARPLAGAVPLPGISLLALGGLLYTIGVLFFVWEERRYSHAAWHLFVLAGSGCHFWAVMAYALP
jgi:hemolysin III